MQKSSDYNSKDLYKRIGSKIKQRRKELNLTQSKVAENIGVEYIQIQRYEKGQTRIPLENLLKLSGLFNVSMEYFYKEFKVIEKQNKSAQLSNPELEKEIMILREIYDYNDENLIYIAKNNIELAYGLLKKERRIRKNARDPKKKMA